MYISSDDLNLQKATMSVKLLDFSGNIHTDELFSVDIPGNTSLVYYDTLQTALIGNLNPGELALLVTLDGDSTLPDMVKEKNLLYFVSPKELQLPVPVISKKVKETPTGYAIVLSCDKLVKNLFLSTSVKGDFSDNYFDMLPGVPVEVQFNTPDKNPNMADLILVKSLIDTY